MSSHPGYLLPAGECFTEEMACALVFYPDKPEYRRALFGSLVYLSTWLAWERDEDKRGKDAARAWKDAVDLTVECMNMACLEDLINNVETIRILMENKKDCCDDNITYMPDDPPETEINPNVGDPPEFYGVTEISDWDEWSEHVCYNAHKYVDYLVASSGNLFDAVKLSSVFLGLIAAILSLLAFSGIGLPIAFGLAATIVAGIALGATATTFLNTSDNFEDNRENIVCAILTGNSLADAVEAALSSDTDWDLFYQFVDYASAVAIIYEGGFGSEYLPAETRDDCICDAELHFRFTFDEDVEGFTYQEIGPHSWEPEGCIAMAPNEKTTWNHGHYWTWNQMEEYFDGLTLPVDFDQFRFRWYNSLGTGDQKRFLFYIVIYGADDETWTSETIDSDEWSHSEWHDVIWNLPETMTSATTINHMWIWMYKWVTLTGGQRIWMDNFGLYKR